MVFGYFWDVTVLFPAKLQAFMVTKHVEETKKTGLKWLTALSRQGRKLAGQRTR